jgi:serine/threonine protein kinase
MVKTAYTADQQRIELSEEIGKGGEASVYLINKSTVAKIYNTQNLTPEKESKVLAIINKNMKIDGVCLPIEILLDEKKKFIGYTMPKANINKGYEMQTCVFNPELLKRKFPNWTRVNLVNLSLTILNKIQLLHDSNIIIGDINPFNILIKDDKIVYFVDTDSYQVDNYTCPVGTVHFTAPEIQNIKSFSETIRTLKHEYFAIATLLFMIFHPGKSPYAFQGGGNIKENIINMNFSYPLGDEDNYMAPQGMWEYIWSELSYEIRKAFYTVFKENYRFSLKEWINVLEIYKEDLSQGVYQLSIFPSSTERILQGRTINMNRRDINENDPNIRNGKTILMPNAKGSNIGVLELSTKAVKFITGNQNHIRENGFNFDYFSRTADKTETGMGLDTDNYMDLNFYGNKVLPYINKMLKIAKEKEVDTLYVVATAAYRTANNRSELVEFIRNKCGINVKILSKKEEARATLIAFAFCKKPNIILDSNLSYLMIDQGGGSTELSLFQSNEIIDSYSLNLGTSILKNVMFKESTNESSLSKGFKDSEKLIKDRLRTYLSNPKSSGFLNKNKGDFIVANGTAITQASGRSGNKKQHCVVLTKEDIKNSILKFEEYLNNNFSNSKELLDALEGTHTKQRDELDRILVSRLGLPMFLEIMNQINIPKLVINGTGLWYGIYFENLYNLNG